VGERSGLEPFKESLAIIRYKARRDVGDEATTAPGRVNRKFTVSDPPRLLVEFSPYGWEHY
jgi:SpoVK/Ycf46/Vps4 family AAA+-type ATPase